MIERATIAQPRLTAGGQVRIPPHVAELAERVLRGAMSAKQANRMLRKGSRSSASSKDAALAGARARLAKHRAKRG